MKRLSLFIIFIMVSIFTLIPSSVLAQSDLITSMGDLPYLERYGQDQVRALSVSPDEEEPKNIIILYEEASENNIGNLGLEVEDFSAGATVSNRVDVLRTAEGTNAEEIINEISSKEGVISAAEDDICRAFDLPNDKHVEKQDYFTRIGADKTWNTSTEELIKVAVLDTGIDPNHEDLIGRIDANGIDIIDGDSQSMEDPEGHGTEVSSVIAATANNEVGICGVSGTSNVSIVPCRVLDENGEGGVSGIAACLVEISQRPDVRVINLSLGVDHPNAVLESACEIARGAGKIIVAASGNDNADVMYPAALDSAIAVGAVNAEDQRCSPADWEGNNGSSYGPEVELVAPGEMVACASPGNLYIYNSGTSFSAPMVSAACAVVLTHNPNLTQDEVRGILNTTAEDLHVPGRDNETGYGLLRLDRALDKTLESYVGDVRDLRILTPQYNLQVGQERQIEYVSSLTNGLVWTTSNPGVATVNEAGVVSAVAPGEADITVSSESHPIVTATCKVQVSPLELSYSAQVENVGWMAPVGNNAVAGTTGQGLKLETLRFDSLPEGLDIHASVHVENEGNMGPFKAGEDIGTVGLNEGIESISLTLYGSNSVDLNVYYRAHVENYGWTDWASNGQLCGSQGQNLQLEAVQVYIAPSNAEAPQGGGDVDWIYLH